MITYNNIVVTSFSVRRCPAAIFKYLVHIIPFFTPVIYDIIYISSLKWQVTLVICFQNRKRTNACTKFTEIGRHLLSVL
jgi:hypothetical protein